jgi:hypothetical protein
MFQNSSKSLKEWHADPLVRGMFLPTETWQSVLQQGFNASAFRIESYGRPFGAVTGFRAGPFLIGYLNFPSGLPLAPSARLLPPPHAMRGLVSSAGLDVLRFTLPFADPRFITIRTNHTLIENLQKWSAQSQTKSRRTRNKLSRGDVWIRPASLADVESVYDLYTGTVRRHDGQLRYPVSYFSALIRLSREDSRVRVLVAGNARSGSELLVAFIAFVVGETRGYYLHGGHDPEFRSLYAADQLFLTMIREARLAGADELDLLASPEDQSLLTRYKESWGGQTKPMFQYSIGRSRLVEWAVRAGQWLDHRLGGLLSGAS